MIFVLVIIVFLLLCSKESPFSLGIDERPANTSLGVDLLIRGFHVHSKGIVSQACSTNSWNALGPQSAPAARVSRGMLNNIAVRINTRKLNFFDSIVVLS